MQQGLLGDDDPRIHRRQLLQAASLIGAGALGVAALDPSQALAVESEEEKLEKTLRKIGAKDNIIIGANPSAPGNENTTIGVGAGAGLTGTSRCNIALGPGAIGKAGTGVTFNIAIGEGTLGALTSGGHNNIAIGAETGRLITTGGSNVGVGVNSLYKLTTGEANTAVGTTSLEQMTGDKSTGIGAGAGYAATGSAIVAIGYEALCGSIYTSGPKEDEPEVSATAEGTVAIGAFALSRLETGAGNTAVGWNAIYSMTTGGKNTCIGEYALAENKTGSKNTCIGARAGWFNTSGSGNVFIGSEAGEESGTESNQLYIANSFTSSPLIRGEFPNASLLFNTEKLALYKGVTPVARHAAITALGSSATGTEIATAVNALREALKKVGITE